MSDDRTLPDELLADSEETLRLVDSLLEELHEDEDEVGEPSEPSEAPRLNEILVELSDRSAGLAMLPIVLLRAYREIVSALDALKLSRDVFERFTIKRVQNTHQKLREVSSATEVATIDILDGLDRAARLVDKLDEAAAGADETTETEDRIRQELRNEIFQLTGVLQFQDITSQQLNFSASVLLDIEARLSSVADLFDRTLGVHAESADAPVETTGDHSTGFDPDASMMDAADRQAMVDEIFGVSDLSDKPSEV